MTTVEIKNVQAIRELVIDLPDNEGGVMVLKGRNAAGKSTALSLLSGLLSGRGSFDPRDGTKKGLIEGLGKKVTVGGSTRFSGELEVPALEGRFDFSDLVRPAGKTQETRDKVRVKALLGLSGATADASLFYDILGGKENFDLVVPREALDTNDLVDMADRVRRAIHKKAGDFESEAARENGYAQSCRDAAGDVKDKTKPDLDSIQSAAYAAEKSAATIKERKRSAVAERERIDSTRARVEEARKTYTGPTEEDAKAKRASAQKEFDEANESVKALKAQLARAEDVMRERSILLVSATKAHEQAKQHAALIASLSESLETHGSIDEPSDMDIALADQEVEVARRAVIEAAQAIKAIEKSEEALAHSRMAYGFTEKAEELRDAAKTVDECLTKALPAGPLRSENGVMVMDTQRGKGVPFDECSDGERWLAALPYGIRSVGTGGVIN
jgi:energy-coupling factor transporter ATP-binding protein EcfA2